MDTEDKKKSKSENETIQKLCQNRKKQNFQALKQWDQIRAHKLITHRKVADEIDDVLQARITQSNQFLRVVMQFLSDRQTQQKKYQGQAVANPESKLQANSVSRNIHITTSQCLTRLYKATQNFKCYKKVKATLEEGIRNIENMLTESERDIMEIRTKIQLKAVQIQNENGLTIQKCDELVLANKDGATKLLHAETDLFQVQNQFLQQTVSQTKTQQSYGEAVVEFLKCVEKYEKDKLQLVRQTLQKYLLSLEQTGQDNQSLKPMLDILQKRTQDQIIHFFYSSEEFLSKQVMRDILKAECKDQKYKLDLNVILNFLTKIKYHPFDCRNLMLKQYKTYLKNQEGELENSYLIVTVDAFLHIYRYEEQFEILATKPEYSLKCNNSINIKREGDTGLEIKVKKWQLISLAKDEGEAAKVVFLNEDQREEFIQFVGRISM